MAWLRASRGWLRSPRLAQEPQAGGVGSNGTAQSPVVGSGAADETERGTQALKID